MDLILRRTFKYCFAVFLVCFSVLLINMIQDQSAKAFTTLDLSPTIISTSAITPSPVSRNNNPAKSNDKGLDPLIVAAIIGFVSAIAAACVSSVIAIYLNRKSSKLEKDKLEIQNKYERENLNLQQQQKIEIEKVREQNERERLRLQKEIEKQIKINERIERNKIEKLDTLRVKMTNAHTPQERIQTYHKALHADPRISRLQILDMSRPLEVTQIYVRLRIHQNARPSFDVDPMLHDLEKQQDPNALLRASQAYLENRINAALDPDEAIHAYRHCIILGDPGAGKTTLLKHLVLKSVDNQLDGLPDFPIYIGLNAFAGSGYRDLLDFISDQWYEDYGFPSDEALTYIDHALAEGKALVLLDALDETVVGESLEGAEASYTRTANAIMRLATRYPQSHIIVTARKAGYQQRASLTGFTELEVLDFRLEDIHLFVKNWFEASSDAQKLANADDLNDKLERNPRILMLAANPLLLSLIVLVYEARLELPERRAILYERCVETLLTEWDAKRNIQRRRQFQSDHKRLLLQEVAWHFHLQGRRYFPRHELLEVIAVFLPAVRLSPEQNREVLDEIITEHGLLKEQAQGWYGFLHLTLQEYFAARYVSDHKNLDSLLGRLGDPWWEEVLLLYSGQTYDASPLLQKLLTQSDKGRPLTDLFYTNLVLAGRCLAARPIIIQASLGDEVVSKLFEALTATPYDLAREQIAYALVAIGEDAINERLVRLLFSGQVNIAVRKYIIEAIGRLKEQSMIPELIRLLFDEKIDPVLRRSAIEVLGRLKEQSMIPELIRLLFDEKIDPVLRRSAIEALDKLGKQSITSYVILLLADKSKEVSVRQSVAIAFSLLGRELDLVQLLSNENVDASIRRSVIGALGRLRDRSVIAELVRLLSDEQVNPSVRRDIALALGRLGDRSVVLDFMQLLSDDRVNVSVRGSIALALGRLGDRSVVLDLIQLFSDDRVNVSVRGSIALALGRLGDRSVVPELLSLLSQEKKGSPQCKNIIISLGMLGERSVASQLIQLLLDASIQLSMRREIATTLGLLSERSVAESLVRFLPDEKIDPYLRGDIAMALGVLGEQAIIDELVNLLSNEKVHVLVRRRIAIAIGMLRCKPIAAELVKLLSDEKIDPSVRQDIATTLGILGERSIATDLVKLLSNDNDKINSRVCQEVATTLGTLGVQTIAAELAKLLPDERIDPYVRQCIATTLGALNERSVTHSLLQLLKQENFNTSVLRCVVAALGNLINNEVEARELTIYLNEASIANDVYRSLWAISINSGIRIFIKNRSGKKQFEVVKDKTA